MLSNSTITVALESTMSKAASISRCLSQVASAQATVAVLVNAMDIAERRGFSSPMAAMLKATGTPVPEGFPAVESFSALGEYKQSTTQLTALEALSDAIATAEDSSSSALSDAREKLVELIGDLGADRAEELLQALRDFGMRQPGVADATA